MLLYVCSVLLAAHHVLHVLLYTVYICVLLNVLILYVLLSMLDIYVLLVFALC